MLRYDDGGWAEAVGGHPALDLVNTVAWRPDPGRTVDRLTDGAALVRWAEFVGLVDRRRAARFRREVDDETVRRVRRLREQVHRVVQPVAVGDRPAAEDVDSLRRTLLGVLGRARVVAVLPVQWSTGLASATDLPDELGLHAWRLLEREDAHRLRQCRADDCGWLFLDRSRNGSRRRR